MTMAPWNLTHGQWSKNLTMATDILESTGGELMTTFGDLGNYVSGFTCSPHEI